MGIVVIGAVFVDIKGYPLSTYIPGGRNAGRVEQVHGGVCRNVAEDIANVELRPTFVSLVDDTGSGQDVIDKLARHKVNTRYIQRMPDGMGTWLAVFNNDGDVCAAISKRPDTTPLTALLKEKGDEIFSDCDGIAIEFDLEKETVKQILHFAKKYRKKVYAAVSNMSIAMERRSLLQEIDCFVCNQQEAGLMFSDDYGHLTPDEMRATLAANVRSANIPCMVVTMGEQGAVYARTDGESGMVPAKKVDVIDTTGAGDAFFAGTVIGLTYGKTLAEAMDDEAWPRPARSAAAWPHRSSASQRMSARGSARRSSGWMCRSQTDFFCFLARIFLILPFFRFRTFCLFSSFLSAHFRQVWPFQCISVSGFCAHFFKNLKYLVIV